MKGGGQRPAKRMRGGGSGGSELLGESDPGVQGTALQALLLAQPDIAMPPPPAPEKPAPGAVVGMFPCKRCDFVAFTGQGLGGHQRKHRDERISAGLISKGARPPSAAAGSGADAVAEASASGAQSVGEAFGAAGAAAGSAAATEASKAEAEKADLASAAAALAAVTAISR